FGTVLNEKQTEIFNSFINNMNPFDVPLGGIRFTWTNKWASKMSKLDRFLATEGFHDSFPNITGFILEKGDGLGTYVIFIILTSKPYRRLKCFAWIYGLLGRCGGILNSILRLLRLGNGHYQKQGSSTPKFPPGFTQSDGGDIKCDISDVYKPVAREYGDETSVHYESKSMEKMKSQRNMLVFP
nr:RNA-directed DNA polymerase, eukaryota [Tanacetum cinerariifolium]